MQRGSPMATAWLVAGLLTAVDASAGDSDYYTLFNPTPTD